MHVLTDLRQLSRTSCRIDVDNKLGIAISPARTGEPTQRTSFVANPDHLALLLRGSQTWNAWRDQNRSVTPDLRGAVLRGANLGGDEWGFGRYNLLQADLTRADLAGANLQMAMLSGAGLSGADLHHANLAEAELAMANLSNATLDNAVLIGAELLAANLSGASMLGTDLQRANFQLTNCSSARFINANLLHARFIATKLAGATLDGCRVYGLAAWDVRLEKTTQQDLIITQPDEPEVKVDDLQLAQLLYLLLENARVRSFVDALTSKVVLILGNFGPSTKPTLDSIRLHLRDFGFAGVQFDFDPSPHRNLTETIELLAGLSRFIIADLTNARSIPQELQRIIPNNPSVPIMPIILDTQYEYGMFGDMLDYASVLTPYRYSSPEVLIGSLHTEVIEPAEKLAVSVQNKRSALLAELRTSRNAVPGPTGDA